MTFTRHFKHIPGTSIEDEEDVRKPLPAIVCGGPGHCLPCTEDELKAFRQPAKFKER